MSEFFDEETGEGMSAAEQNEALLIERDHLRQQLETERARVAEHEEEMELFTAVAVMICQQESNEWDSDRVQTHKDYAEVCGQRIAKLTPVNAKAWLLRKQAEAVEPAIRTALRNLGNADITEEDIKAFAYHYAQRLRTQAAALERQSEGGE